MVIFVASVKYDQKLSGAAIFGSFQVVGKAGPSTLDTVKAVREKVKTMLGASHLNFDGEVDFVVDSLVQFEDPPEFGFILNFEERNGDGLHLMEVPLDQDAEKVKMLHSTRIGTGVPLLTMKDNKIVEAGST